MPDMNVDLRNKPKVIDFLLEMADFSDPSERKVIEKTVAAYQDGTEIRTEQLAAIARTAAFAAWPARYAIQRFFAGEGMKEEWQAVAAAIRPATAHLLKRVQQSSGGETLDEVLAHADAETAFHAEDRQEIAQVRLQHRAAYWNAHTKSLAFLVKEGATELQAVRARLDTLRELAGELSQGLQDEIFSKIAYYEDRIIYGGEVVPLSILDEEVAYYTEQQAISPMEE